MEFQKEHYALGFVYSIEDDIQLKGRLCENSYVDEYLYK
jgi:hypothetical protein